MAALWHLVAALRQPLKKEALETRQLRLLRVAVERQTQVVAAEEAILFLMLAALAVLA